MTPVAAPLSVLVSGASGMIGSALTDRLRAAGHSVAALVRHEPTGPGQHAWDPSEGRLDPAVLDGVDVVVNLSGASIARIPWTPAYKREILASRLDTTRTITAAMSLAERSPSALVNASAVGFYGDRPGEELTESSSRGAGFLADVVVDWEAAAHSAPPGVRVATARTGVVIGPGGAMAPLRLLTRLGLSGPLAGGRQVWPWISLVDEAAALHHLVESRLAGPVNLAGPTPATADDIMRTLAAKMERPYVIPAPRPLVALGLGEAGRELLLPSQHEVPAALTADGFRFEHRTIGAALDALLAG